MPAGVDDPARVAARWLAGSPTRVLPDDVVAAARRALLDWFACCIAGSQAPVVSIVRKRAQLLSPTGAAPVFFGGTAAAPWAAFIHACAAHAHDFDDTHIYTDAHFSGPTWAALLAQRAQIDAADDDALCRAYVAGFEVGAKLGGRRLGHAMAQRGFQATGLMGRLAAAAAGAVLCGLDEERSVMALALAATQSAGLTASFGTMLKAFQGGKTAFDAVLAVELAADGMTATSAIFEADGGLARALVQDGTAQIAVPDFTACWEVLRNSTKAYPCLHGLHPVIDAARELYPQLAGRAIAKVRVDVAPGVPRMARYGLPKTVDEAKFSIPYVAALGLTGRRAMLADFGSDVLNDARIRALIQRVDVVPVEGRKMIDAAMAVTLDSGETLTADVPVARGHPGRPLSEEEMRQKFESLVMPVLGERTGKLWAILGGFPDTNAVARAVKLLAAAAR